MIMLDADGYPQAPEAVPFYEDGYGDGYYSGSCEDEGAPLPPIRSAIVDRDDLPPLSPELIEGVLRQGHKLMIAGKSKAGKTWLLIELAVAVASGGQWLGRQCAQGRVLYVNLELDEASFMRRVCTVTEAMGADKQKVYDNLGIWNLRGFAVPLGQLNTELFRMVGEGEYAAIVLDPLYKIQGGDENAARDIGTFCRGLDEICARLGSSVIYCHHHSKGAQGGKDAADRASGSGVFARDADALLDMTELALGPAAVEACGIIHREGASAWRIEAVLREFPFMEPFEIWFKYPIHFLDDTDTLAGCDVRGSGGRRGGSSIERVRDFDAKCDALFGGRESVGMSELESVFGLTRNTVINRLEQSALFEYEAGTNRSNPAKARRKASSQNISIES